jgi:hypothetical protein
MSNEKYWLKIKEGFFAIGEYYDVESGKKKPSIVFVPKEFVTPEVLNIPAMAVIQSLNWEQQSEAPNE